MITAAALLGAAGISAGASLLGGLLNWGESRAARKEAAELDRRNFEEQQKMNRFQMDAANKQMAETQRMNDHSVKEDWANRLNDTFKTNVALRDRMVSLWGGGK